MTIGEFIKRCETYNPNKITFDILWAHKEDILKIQRSQLWAGMNARGEKITPNILNDPYFEEKAAKINSRRKKKKHVTAAELAHDWAKGKASALNNMAIPFQLLTEPEFGTYNYGDVNLIFSTGEVVWKQLGVKPIGSSEDLIISLNNFPLFEELTKKYEDLFGLNPQGAKYALKQFFEKEFFAKTREHFFGNGV
jgi:hypothetical protein